MSAGRGRVLTTGKLQDPARVGDIVAAVRWHPSNLPCACETKLSELLRINTLDTGDTRARSGHGRHTARVAHLFAVSEAVGVGVGQAQVA